MRTEAIKERMYMQRELRRILKSRKKWGYVRNQGRLDFLIRELNYSYLIWN